MKPRKIVTRMQQSAPARCEYEVGRATDAEGVVRIHRCDAPMQLVIKYPRVWSYQERVSERCSAGHISHGQAVVEMEDDSTDCWGAF